MIVLLKEFFCRGKNKQTKKKTEKEKYHILSWGRILGCAVISSTFWGIVGIHDKMWSNFLTDDNEIQIPFEKFE